MTRPTTLDPQIRGDDFRYDFTLGNGWVGADFTGGVKFTLRDGIPASTVVSDDDAVDQATTDDGDLTITGTAGSIVIPGERTTAWQAKRLQWDLQGTITGTPDRVYTIDRGEILIVGDVTRS